MGRAWAVKNSKKRLWEGEGKELFLFAQYYKCNYPIFIVPLYQNAGIHNKFPVLCNIKKRN